MIETVQYNYVVLIMHIIEIIIILVEGVILWQIQM